MKQTFEVRFGTVDASLQTRLRDADSPGSRSVVVVGSETAVGGPVQTELPN